MTTTSYLTAAEATALIGSLLLSTEAPRVAFAALGDADKLVLLARATAQIDQCRWVGEVEDDDQPLMWPRVDRDGDQVPTTERSSGYTYIDPELNTAFTHAYAPRAVYEACVLQAAFLAMSIRGLDTSAHVAEAARRGVVSQSVGGQSESIDIRRATEPWAQLCRAAQDRLGRYRATAVEMV